MKKKIVFLVSIFIVLGSLGSIAAAQEGDFDGDGILDSVDNCPTVYNPEQADSDGTPASDFVSYWTLDEDSGTIASDSIGTNDATIYGATWTTGQVDGALDFDGVDDRVSIPISGSNPLKISGDKITLEAWIKPDKCSGFGSYPEDGSMVLVYRTSNDKYRISVGGTCQVSVAFEGGPSPGNVTRDNNVISTGQWYHIVGTYDGSYI